MKKLLMLAMCLLFVSQAKPQMFGKPIVLTYDKSTNDGPDYPAGVYFTFRATLDPITQTCNQFSKIGYSGATQTFTDTQVVPTVTYCYAEAFYNGVQSRLSDIVIVEAQ
jgi:hypothetical protein